jgi:predicted nuclease of predicted toxin-antitoxin system
VLVSKDRDFADWALTRSPAPVVIWIRSGNMSNRDQQPRFLRAWAVALERLEQGARLIEIR